MSLLSLAAVEPYLSVTGRLQARLRDPLAHFRFAVPRLREALQLFTSLEPPDELLIRGPNKGGKTLSGAAYMVACLQKRSELDGVKLPRWRGRVEGLQCVLDNPTQLLSVQPAYERILGLWPHHPTRNGPYLSALHVMPVGGDPDRMKDWSVVYFRTLDNPNTGIGARADVCCFDEPPPMKPLQELRKAAHAGRRGLIIIPMTPTIRRQWAPLRENYGDTDRRSIRRVDQERAEVRWSMDEVADWVLSKAEKDSLWRRYQGDPLFGKDGGARWHGDYENTEGASPWGPAGDFALLEMMKECSDPRMVKCLVQRETLRGEPVTTDSVMVQIFGEARQGMSYYIPIDPASGVDDNKHNPQALHVREHGTGNLMARWNGYLAPYQVGVLAAGLARRLYNDAEIDIEMKDHWGVNVYNGVTAINGGNYWNLCRETRETRPGVWTPEIGFDQNEETKSVIIGNIQEWLAAWRAGERYAPCPSREILKCLLDCTLDERGKVVYELGIDHGEDFILWGQGLRRTIHHSGLDSPELYQEPKSIEAQVMAKVMRLDQPDDHEPIMQAPERSAI